jgi:hypothetical protein
MNGFNASARETLSRTVSPVRLSLLCPVLAFKVAEPLSERDVPGLRRNLVGSCTISAHI